VSLKLYMDAHILKLRFGPCIDDLALFAQLCEPDEFANRVEYLP
jgi:hypothetical protein